MIAAMRRTMCVAWLASCGVAFGAGGCDDPANSERPDARPGYVATELAQSRIDNGELIVIDVRGADSFEDSRLPGARSLPAADLRAEIDGIGGQVLPSVDAQPLFEAAGLRPSDDVLLYGAFNDTDSARALWTLAYYGHTGELSVLDGGFEQWIAEGRPLDDAASVDAPGAYAVAAVDALRVDVPWILDHLDDPRVTIIDARSTGEYDAGHIPGALSLEWMLNFDPEGLLLPDAELATLYGEPPTTQTRVTYCQTGSRASVDWLVLRALGYADVRLYDGSWAEWSADPSLPVE